MQKGRSIVSRDGILFTLLPREYLLCHVIADAYRDTAGQRFPVPFHSDVVRNFVFLLRITSHDGLEYPDVLDKWDDETRAGVVTLANYVNCPHIVSMCAWRHAKGMDKEEDKQWKVLSWVGL